MNDSGARLLTILTSGLGFRVTGLALELGF